MINENANFLVDIGATNTLKTPFDPLARGSIKRGAWNEAKNATTMSIIVTIELSEDKISARAGHLIGKQFLDLDLSPDVEEEYDETFWARQLERLNEEDKFVRFDDI